MKIALQWGGINTAGLVIISLASYLLGFQTEKLEQGQAFQWIGLPIFIAAIVFGIREARNEAGEAGFSYGAGVLTAFKIGVATAIFSALYVFIHFSFINTQFLEYLLPMIRDKMKEVGASAADFEKMEPFFRGMYGPMGQSAISFVVGIVMALVIGLVAAAFLKKPAASAET